VEGKNQTDMTTNAIARGEDENETRIQIIKKLFGQQAIGNEPMVLSTEFAHFQMRASALLSKPNTVSQKKNTFILFINSKFQ